MGTLPFLKGWKVPGRSQRFYMSLPSVGGIALCLCLVLVSASPSLKESSERSNNSETHAGSETKAGSKNNQVKIATTPSEKDYVDTKEILRQALINHTLVNEGQEDLDELIFSSLPKGARLILQSVKVVETDEHGHPVSTGKSIPVHWDVKITNATDEGALPEDDEEEEEDEEEESQAVAETKHLEPQTSQQVDMALAGSHSQANYKSYGGKERGKKKSQKHYTKDDYGKGKKITLTDTDGKTVTNTKGKNADVIKYDKDHKDAHSDEGERYKHTKKNNKGRRVSGFKRVYHKEEFQRTEHFFDDDHANGFAEKYGNKGATSEQKKGIKDDDKKFHGTKTEYLDGKKIKDEKSKSHAFHHGNHKQYGDSEKAHHGGRYSNSKSQGYGSANNHHPNHQASYSQPQKSVAYSPPANNNGFGYYYMNFKPGYVLKDFQPSKNPFDPEDSVAVMSKAPITASFTVTEAKDNTAAASTDEPLIFNEGGKKDGEDEDETKDGVQVTEKEKDKSKMKEEKKSPLDEKRMYFSPRNRYVEQNKEDGIQTAGKGNPYKKKFLSPHYDWTTFMKTPFVNKAGNASEEDRDKTHDRDGRKLISHIEKQVSRPYGEYSTLKKVVPVNYINLEDDRNETESQSHLATYTPQGSVAVTTVAPIRGQQRPTRPQRPWGYGFGIGSPEMIKDIHSNPGYKRIPYRLDPHSPKRHPNAVITKIMRGMKHRLIPPMVGHRLPPSRPRPHKPGHLYEITKYPPNIVAKIRMNNATTIPQSQTVEDEEEEESGQEEEEAEDYDESSLPSRHTDTNPNPIPNPYPSRPYGHGHGHGHGHGPSRYKMPNPIPLPPFINTLMSSVASFFGSS